MEMSLKLLADADLELVADLHLDPLQERFAGGTLETVFHQMRVSPRRQAWHRFAILAAEAPVGFFVMREVPALPQWAPGDAMTLHSFRIGKNHQHRGYGRQGIRLAARWILLNRRGIRNLMLSVNTDNRHAQALYFACGFADTGATHHGSVGQQKILTCDIRKLARAG